MRYNYSFAGALLLAPAALASPIAAPNNLEARATSLPTCNPNNVEYFKTAVRTPAQYCSKLAAKPTAAVVTGLTGKQVTNICKCVLATKYVSNTPLTKTSSVKTTTKATTKTTTKTTTTTTKASTTSSKPAATTSAAAACKAGVAKDSAGVSFKTSCNSSFDGLSTGVNYSVGSSAACQAKCLSSASCAGAVYTIASRSCVLYSEVDGIYDSAGSIALQYISGRGGSSSSSSMGASSSAKVSSTKTSAMSSMSSSTSASNSAPSVFNMYLASTASATTGGSVIAAATADRVGGMLSLGIFPTPTAVAKKMKRDTCTEGASLTVSGNDYALQCGQKFEAESDTVNIQTADQPSTGDNISSLDQCIDFCAKVDDCKAVSFDATTGSSSPCVLFSEYSLSALTTTTNDKYSYAYRQSNVPAVSWYLDSASGYVYVNDTTAKGVNSGIALCADITNSETAGNLVATRIQKGSFVPLTCTMDSQSRLSCTYTADSIYYSKLELTPTEGTVTVDDVVQKVQQYIQMNAGSKSQISLYAAPLTAAVSGSVDATPANTVLVTAKGLINKDNVLPTAMGFANVTSAGALNLTYAIPSGGDQSEKVVAIALSENVFLYKGDEYQFSASLDFPFGKLVSGLTCDVEFSVEGNVIGDMRFDSTFPSTFDIVFNGVSTRTRTVAAALTVTCVSDNSAAYNFPIMATNVKLVANPSEVAKSLYAYVEAVAATSSSPAVQLTYEQYYNGTGYLMPTGSDTTTVIGTNNVLTTQSLYVNSQNDAVNTCAKTASSFSSSQGGFELYYDGGWKCVVFANSWASDSAFNVKSATATSVLGYYLNTLVTSK